MKSKHLSSAQGFSLVELLVVIAVIAIIAAIAIPNIANITGQATIAKDRRNAQNIASVAAAARAAGTTTQWDTTATNAIKQLIAGVTASVNNEDLVFSVSPMSDNELTGAAAYLTVTAENISYSPTNAAP